MNKIVYKVLRQYKYSQKLVSVYMTPSNGQFRLNLQLEYSTEFITLPYGNSLIFAFADLERAKTWRNRRKGNGFVEHECIWEAKTSEIIVPRASEFMTMYMDIVCNFKGFWDCYNNGWKTNKAQSGRIPEGTVLCPNLILTKRVYD